MLSVKKNEERFFKKHDIWRAKTVALFFLRRAFRTSFFRIVSVFLLAFLTIACQIGFLFLLTAFVQRLTGAQITQYPAIAQFLQTVPDIAIAVAAVITLLVLALAAFVIQYITAVTNNRVFSRTMHEITAGISLVRSNRTSLAGYSSAQFMQMYTKGARYAGILVSKSLRVCQPVIAIPALLFFCTYTSPVLSAITAAIVLVSLPFHIMIIRRGLIATRGLLNGAIEHRRSKNQLIDSMLEFPGFLGLGVPELNKLYVDEGSQQYLHYYKQRRLLASLSLLVSSLTAFAIVAMVLAVLVTPEWSPTLSLDVAIAYVVALRFLSVSVGQIVTYCTTALSLTPLLEQTHAFLTQSTATSAIETGNDRGDIPTIEIPKTATVPSAVILSKNRMTQSGLAKFQYLSGLGIDPDYPTRPVLVTPNYPGIHDNLNSNLLLNDVDDINLVLEDSTPQSVSSEVIALLKEEADSDHKQNLWGKISDNTRIFLTLRAALASDGKFIFLSGNLGQILGPKDWADFEWRVAASHKQAIQFIDAIPKRPKYDPEQAFFTWNGAKLEKIAISDGQDITTILREKYAGLKEQAKLPEMLDDLQDFDDDEAMVAL